MSEINCNNCAISDFKESLCKRCDKMKRIGSADDIEKLIIECLPSVQADVPDTNVGDTIYRQAAIEAIADTLKYEDYGFLSDELESVINNVPAADVVEVVRCKDCKHKEREQPGMVYCPMMVGSWVADDHFCKWGERRE